ncbi:formate dehydrogenase subunit alpha [Halomonas elongata]|uniref:Formate dehydrogenase subunit alpha n=1 Tax=Halomonas elongata (strain ATCC 33173 / DSM 2581 / NBRC 15536 / NCIMB 2198 / 1H9) TaxID=768066 RepID=E1V906_HALED|nr:formate dehydrogenase subunit alpha [Halomonas elongata]RAW07148.1 formate dehydrogenase subunit alpha [Halomonas elongata]WBF19026.1 formate dehydrogenase subunit alpha [Halomonas elongata]WPU47885.1 formate dehydrogenase subunit alpha [Halomonas elongata DSM 2581]CBV41781.1 homolog to NADH-quinone oxidoreductase subunit NuoG [Halomonas elongata DSM 2581]
MIGYYDPNKHASKDLGTPARLSEKHIALTIDGQEITVPEGTSVLRAAALADINIPKLCASDNLEAFGSCRMCAVQVEGKRGYPAACTTPVEAGMQVTTQNTKLARLRRNIMELYISDHPLDCLTCPANGDCELQDVAGAVGLREVRYGFEGENHLSAEKDNTNPYFSFDPSKCIVCSRCVRACEEVQGTFALTIDGRGFDSKVSPGQMEDFMDSECVSCGACVQACPTATLMEKSVIDQGVPEHSVITTCAYCGVGCSFKAEMKGDQLVRMVPYKGGDANHGHSCVKGRFAFGYATHGDRLTTPMIRDSIDQPWREVGWEEAINFAAERLKATQAKYGRESIGGITSSRCTNEETYLVQKLIRAAFGNNNTDTCARVCHSPTGYGLKTTLGESAGTQTFDSVMKSDAIIVIGANPTDAHPVFASQMRRRMREGASLIVADPRHIDLLDTPHRGDAQHLPLRPGTNVALVNALAHVVVSEGLEDHDFIAKRCDTEAYQAWRDFISEERHAPEAVESITGVSAEAVRHAARTYAKAPNGAIYYGLGVTEHSQGSTMVMGIANLAMATGNIGREGVGVNPLRGQNNVQGSCDMGSFPHELPGYQHVADATARSRFEELWGVPIDDEPGLRIPNMFDAAIEGSFKALYVQGEDIAQSDPNTQHVEAALTSLDCLIVQDIFLNETAKYAHVLLPGSSFLEKNGTFTNAERRINRVRKVMPPRAGKEDWEVTVELSRALGYPMDYRHPSEIMDEIAQLTPTFTGVSYDKLERLGSLQWPCNAEHPEGTPTMHEIDFPIGPGRFAITEYVATEERANRRFPLLLTTGRILSQYNVGAQTRRTDNQVWHDEDILEIHPSDAEVRGINDGDWLGITSRSGQTVLRARLSERMQPGVVYTTFHHPGSGANVITTNSSDWATNCPEYKVTAVQVEKVSRPSAWQQRFDDFDREQRHFLKAAKDPAAQGVPQ